MQSVNASSTRFCRHVGSPPFTFGKACRARNMSVSELFHRFVARHIVTGATGLLLTGAAAATHVKGRRGV